MDVRFHRTESGSVRGLLVTAVVRGSQVSRAIGDKHMKQWVTSEPEIAEISLFSGDQFMIIASDGVWDALRDLNACQLVSGCLELVRVPPVRAR